ncbi:MAG: glycogen/starch/alpha-glucan phosphorylase [Candidatus Heteroscillospira sp.]|jgi:starch phosphorylase
MLIDSDARSRKILTMAEELCFCNHQISIADANPIQLHECLAQAVVHYLSGSWNRSRRGHDHGRHAAYLSAEFLIGKLVYSNLYNLGILREVTALLADKGVDLACLEDIEDASLGNGGLGRLAACFLDSAATHGIPLDGYGLRYHYGLFKQTFSNCEQVEEADDWLRDGDPWSCRRYGEAVEVRMADQTVMAVPYDMPVIGYDTGNIGTLRLWQSESENPLDFAAYNRQDYVTSMRDKNLAESITSVLYPDDSTYEGKRLRLKQQYFLCSATMQDMLRRHRRAGDRTVVEFAKYHALQLNDTHPVLAIPELIRLLMLEGLEFERAFTIARDTFSYTNHTVLSEALERWDMALIESVCPDTAAIIRRIDARARDRMTLHGIYGDMFSNMQIIDGGTVHMARLAIYASSHVNGVAAIHTDILKNKVFRDWYAVYPERFQNKTNGITQRRWLGLCNPELSTLIRRTIGTGFLKDLSRLSELRENQDERLIRNFNEVKREKKEQLAAYIKKHEGVELSPDSVFDVQIKRLHEYKRQLMNAFSIMDIYLRLKNGELQDMPPVTFIFGAKAASGYARAKAIIRYINRMAELINNDSQVHGRIRVVFVQNYNCSYAEKIIPAADISEQISPAGLEASGTGNMKLMLNGAVTLGTLDGANVEIVEEAGMENNYIFGATVDDIEHIRGSYNPKAIYDSNEHIRRVVDTLTDGTVPTDDGMRELHSSLIYGTGWHAPDHYFLLLDYPMYMEAKMRAIYDWADRMSFGKKALMNIASAGKFSSDRTVQDYARDIWKV